MPAPLFLRSAPIYQPTAYAAPALVAACAGEQVKEEPAPAARPVAAKPAPPANPLTDPKNILLKRSIFDDFDRYAVTPEYRAMIEAHGAYLK